MCGIFGIVSDQQNVNVDNLINVSNILKHRGPDDEGYLLAQTHKEIYNTYKGKSSSESLKIPYISASGLTYNLALLHRRLSIIDLSDLGHQPMSYDNGNYWIVHNGEIYNYIEIKEQLIKKGHIFLSNTDTEIIVASYKEWGEECVNHFNGMWAFAIWDRLNKTLFLSRDRLGIKPLYYYSNNELIIFCSEIKGIINYIKNHFSFNDNKIREYLIKGQIIIGESNETIFNEIYQLLPAHNLKYKDHEKKITKYWELNINISSGTREFHIEKFTELFQDSIKLMLRSDVEVGSCLSGGIDSSSIVSYASSVFNKKFNTFSAIWPGTRHDEYKYMKLVNDRYSATSNYVETDLGNLLKTIDDITWYQEIPVAGSSLIAQWNIMKRAKEKNVPVLLDGQGADEILSGYPFYLITYLNELFSKFRVQELMNFLKYSDYYGYNLIKIIKLQLKRILNKDDQIIASLPVSPEELNRYRNNLKYQVPQQANILTDFLVEHICKSNLPALLHFEDRNSMAHSIEARVPYLDHRLVEFSLNIPSEQKIGKGFTKTILRDAMKIYLPTEILNRRDKIGFSTPIEENLINRKNELASFMEDSLLNSDLWGSGIIDKTKYNSSHLFALFCLQRFLVIFEK